MRGFAQRVLEPELMDTEPVSFEEFHACLTDLSTVNTVTRARAPTLAWLRQMTKHMRRGDRLSLVDVGCGHGDMLRAVHAWCCTQGFEPDLIGIDINPWSAASARAVTPAHLRIDYQTGDVFDFRPASPAQFVVSSLFAHHLSDQQAVRFIQWMEDTAERGWFINDLHRHPVPFYGFGLMSRLLRWHRFVQHDGPVSIARAFRKSDWERLTRAAGIEPASIQIRWHMPFRICVGRAK
jgi:SAM-dependent methyltransferase